MLNNSQVEGGGQKSFPELNHPVAPSAGVLDLLGLPHDNEKLIRNPSIGPITFFTPQVDSLELSNNTFLHLATLGMHEIEERDIETENSKEVDDDFETDDIKDEETVIDGDFKYGVHDLNYETDSLEIENVALSDSLLSNQDDQVKGYGNIEKRVRKAFELSPDEKLVQEFPCWLVRSILFKGYAYVTEKHLCFYASLPPAAGYVIKGGFLKQRTYTRPRNIYVTHWFSLRCDALVSYANSTVRVC
jgi:hypothetical protein